jgi:hypothetical protein
MPLLTARWTARSMMLRAFVAVACGSVLTYFGSQIAINQKLGVPLRIGAIVLIAAIGIAGIAALLAPDDDDRDAPPPERLYTADEVAALLAAVQAGQLVPVAPATCKFCGGDEPDAKGVDGARYHRACFRAAYQTGKT